MAIWRSVRPASTLRGCLRKLGQPQSPAFSLLLVENGLRLLPQLLAQLRRLATGSALRLEQRSATTVKRATPAAETAPEVKHRDGHTKRG